MFDKGLKVHLRAKKTLIKNITIITQYEYFLQFDFYACQINLYSTYMQMYIIVKM